MMIGFGNQGSRLMVIDEKEKIMNLTNYEEYGVFEEFARTGFQRIYPAKLTKKNIEKYRIGLLNVFKDGVEQNEVHDGRIELYWEEDKKCKLSLQDTFINIVLWSMLVSLDAKIEPYNLFYSKNVTGGDIKDYIDTNVVNKYIDKVDILILNRTIYNGYKHLMDIDIFAEYLANTFDLYDFVELAEKCPEVSEMFERDYSDIPIEEINDFGDKVNARFMEIIEKESKLFIGRDHCCANAIRAKAGLSPRQFKELSVNIGTKPDGRGSIYPHIINTSFINRGLDSYESIFVETASAGRYAQIIAKGNVASSGAFARILGLNNMDTFLNDDPHYTCNTKNFVRLTVTSKKIFNMIIGRYYRWTECGDDHCIREKDRDDLMGKTILLRDPMTCQSKAMGCGICYKCYGKLAYNNCTINIGKIAAEILSSILTQRLLSAKHLLTAKPIKIVFGDMFGDFFCNEEMMITVNPEAITKHAFVKIDMDSIESSLSDDDVDNEEEAALDMNEFVNEFVLEVDGVEYPMHSEAFDPLYLTSEFTDILNRTRPNYDGEKTYKVIALNDLNGIALFQLPLVNNELVKALNDIKHIINLTKVTSSLSKDEILQKFLEAIVQGGLSIHSSHASVIISNQIRDKNDILETPDWSVPNQTNYQILPLSASLNNHPSVTISLMYQGISRMLVTPTTFKKHKSSRMDLYFMQKPQKFLAGTDNYVQKTATNEPVNPLGAPHGADWKTREQAYRRYLEKMAARED